MAPSFVIKRNGTRVPFDIDRIRTAIAKAVVAVDGKITPEIIDQVTRDVGRELEGRFSESAPHVETVQDCVERHLMGRSLYEVAKAYILYRARHSRQRSERVQSQVALARRGLLQIRKRNGKTQAVDTGKIRTTFERAAGRSAGQLDVDRLVDETLKNTSRQMSTDDLLSTMILSAASLIEQDPLYDSVAAALKLQALRKKVIGYSTDEHSLDRAYRESFLRGLRRGVDVGVLDSRMGHFDLETLAANLHIDNDSLLGHVGLQTLSERYLLRIDHAPIELPQSFWMRVAMGIALREENPTPRALEFYAVISSLQFVPSTPTLFHAGTARPQLSSCYITQVDDDLGHIFKSLSDNAQYAKWSGGIANDWTKVRGTGALIKSTRVESQGVVPFLKIANDVTMAINRSGKRRGATCAYLETWHLDIEDFLDLRRNTGDERRRTHDMNTANWIPDLFMKRVRANQKWTLFSSEEVSDLHDLYGKAFEERYEFYERQAAEGKISKCREVDALALWRRMLTRLFETGHPWITFKDAANVRSPQDHAGVVHSSNLCTEITLNTSPGEAAVCNLGSLNLSRLVERTGLVHEHCAATVQTAIRMLDNVIDLNFYPTEEARASNLRHRPIGLGVMGMQDALFRLRMPVESREAAIFCDRTMEFISYHAVLASSRLARERGTYASYSGSKWDRGVFPIDTLDLLEKERGITVSVDRSHHLDWGLVRRHVAEFGMRNSNTMAIAPTATIATIAGCYPSIEPLYKNLFVKANISGEFTVPNRFLVEDLKGLGLWGPELVELLKYHDGDLEPIEIIPDDLKEIYKEVFRIDPLVLIDLSARRGKWIDQSQSHNVFMRGTSGKLLDAIYMHAWEAGLKTTYYLRTLAASQVEKSTLDAGKYGFTQSRSASRPLDAGSSASRQKNPQTMPATMVTNACRLEDPTCESCQ
jgi:ribonucleoside-diphosphate reductase alpha chain